MILNIGINTTTCRSAIMVHHDLRWLPAYKIALHFCIVGVAPTKNALYHGKRPAIPATMPHGNVPPLIPIWHEAQPIFGVIFAIFVLDHVKIYLRKHINWYFNMILENLT